MGSVVEGATAHFIKYGNFDHLAEFGRWKHVRTARIYVESGRQILQLFPGLTRSSIACTLLKGCCHNCWRKAFVKIPNLGVVGFVRRGALLFSCPVVWGLCVVSAAPIRR